MNNDIIFNTIMEEAKYRTKVGNWEKQVELLKLIVSREINKYESDTCKLSMLQIENDGNDRYVLSDISADNNSFRYTIYSKYEYRLIVKQLQRYIKVSLPINKTDNRISSAIKKDINFRGFIWKTILAKANMDIDDIGNIVKHINSLSVESSIEDLNKITTLFAL